MSLVRYRERLIVTLLAMAAILSAPACHAAAIEQGDGEQSAALPGGPLPVFTYRPAKCSPSLLLVVFHGTQRDAAPYRDHARRLADKVCAIVVAPKFNKGRFPLNMYQYGGISDHGRLFPVGNRSVDLVAPIVAWAQEAAGQKGMPYVLIGHSAGAQFLSRVAAYTHQNAARIVVANPSTWVMPNAGISAPFGFSDIKPSPGEALRAYLAQPILVALGGIDTGSEELDVTVDGMAQGANRLVRGHNAFNMAKEAAGSHGWPFNWSLIEVPNVGHSSTKMFSAPEMAAALGK
jgi:poly(3-hydroxybutyrate) depolymerase